MNHPVAPCPPELSSPPVELFPTKQQWRKLQKCHFFISVLPHSLTSSLSLLQQQAANQKLCCCCSSKPLCSPLWHHSGKPTERRDLNSSPSTHLPLSSGLTALMWSSDRSQLMLSGPGTIALQGKRRLALSHRSRPSSGCLAHVLSPGTAHHTALHLWMLPSEEGLTRGLQKGQGWWPNAWPAIL